MHIRQIIHEKITLFCIKSFIRNVLYRNGWIYLHGNSISSPITLQVSSDTLSFIVFVFLPSHKININKGISFF